ncbi:hypothetical protein BJ165DRAFT_1483871 [Panaeolus papilionaceus]|nr:hypothetical protein BJ165DRAFT_1483871 [Panaeolus papilionaceus]
MTEIRLKQLPGSNLDHFNERYIMFDFLIFLFGTALTSVCCIAFFNDYGRNVIALRNSIWLTSSTTSVFVPVVARKRLQLEQAFQLEHPGIPQELLVLFEYSMFLTFHLKLWLVNTGSSRKHTWVFYTTMYDCTISITLLSPAWAVEAMSVAQTTYQVRVQPQTISTQHCLHLLF